MTRALGLTRVAIVEDHLLFAESLEVALSLEGHEVHRVLQPDSVLSTTALLDSVARARSRVALLDLDLGAAGNGARLVEPLTRSGVAVVVVTSNTERARWGECLRYGARAVLDKSSSLNAILATIRRIGDGRVVLPREERESLLLAYHQEKSELRETRRRLETLTGREREVLGRLMEGLPVRDIAHRSVVSEATVRTQVKSILAKLEVSSQLAAVGAAHQARWRPPEATTVTDIPRLRHAGALRPS